MTTPVGAITLLDVQTEFGGAAPIGLGEYYAGGGYVPGSLAGVPASGAISLDNLRGKSAVNYGSVTPSASSIVEGGTSVTFTWSGGVGIPNGTYYWRLSGSNITTNDFASLTGSFTMSGGSGSFTVSALTESAYEGTESFQALVGASSGVPSSLAVSGPVSITEGATYSVTNATSTNEGGSITFYVTTTNYPNGSIYYSLDKVSGSFNATDVTSGVATGSLSISNGSGSTTVAMLADNFSDGNSIFKFNLRTGSTAGTIVAYGPNVTLNDTSQSPPTYSASFSPPNISEGGMAYFQVQTTYVAVGTTLYYTTSGTASATLDIVLGASSGSFTVTGSITYIPVWAAYDILTESNETYTVSVRTGSTSGPVVASASLIINNALGNVTTLALTYTGGTSGGATVLYLQITSIPMYPQAITFNLTYRVNGEAETSAGLSTTTLTVPANQTYSSKVAVFSRNPANLLAAIYFVARTPGFGVKNSNSLSNIWI